MDSPPDPKQRLARMVERQIAERGVRDRRVLDAMRSVPREHFVPGPLRSLAYEDHALPIADDQTISQPYIVALMIEALALQGGEKVLEIGTGSGYSAAVLARIAGEVWSVERIERLAHDAAQVLAGLGCTNVQVRHADGTLGWPEQAPFDAIVVTAGGPAVPDSLKRQLRIGGRLVMPVAANRAFQELLCMTRVSDDRFETESIADVCFVPLLGEEGWTP